MILRAQESILGVAGQERSSIYGIIMTFGCLLGNYHQIEEKKLKNHCFIEKIIIFR
jgi:hypothetical protein